MKATYKGSVELSVLEMLELSNLNSPFTNQWVRNHCQKLADRLVASGRINKVKASYLCTSKRG